jgi:AcrR family transcriptional regulator
VVSEARTRMTADERRSDLLGAAVSEFALTGLHGTSTELIARRAGISHAYLFKLFPTKKALFMACAERCIARTTETFRSSASGASPAERLASMGKAYVEMLENRELLLSQMQLYAACWDPDIRTLARRGWMSLVAEVTELSGAGEDEVRSFFAHGMLLNVAASIDAPELALPPEAP